MSKSQFVFSQVPHVEVPRSTFNRSHGHKTTFNAGYLIPIYVDEALPGDTFKVKLSAFARMATPIKPIMDNLYLDVFFFAVPNRLLWDHWQELCGEKPTPNSPDYTAYLVPQITSPVGGYQPESIFDYMGLPTKIEGLAHSVLPLRAYNLIWNEWFRDQNLQDPAAVHTTDAGDSYADYGLKRRGKRHDYFTSCLPWPQKGPGVEVPIGGMAPVVPDAIGKPVIKPQGTSNTGYMQIDVDANNINFGGTPVGGLSDLQWHASGLQADLSQATAVTINQLREAFQIQRMQERDARGGTRYVEILRSHFGVVSPDARLQRPEYLGGGSVPVVVNPVTQTSPTLTGETPQGNLAAYGVVGVNGIGFTKSFVEHSFVIGLVEVRADLSYQQGLNRMWSRRERYDFYWPVLAHLGEQAVLRREIYCEANAVDLEVFGYQERWAEYRYSPSLITGLFRSNSNSGLDVWHLAQYFTDIPRLNAAFIEDHPPVDRVVAVSEATGPQFLFDSQFSIQATRPMPVYSVPGYIDHF